MKRLVLALVCAAAAPGGALWAQNIVGTWQGTLPAAPANNRPALRIVAKIERNADESLKATLYSVDQNGNPVGTNGVTFQAPTFKMNIAALGATYEGRLNGDALAGTLTQPQGATQLDFVRATPQTAWVIPEPTAPPKTMAADAKPAFEVSTVKPSVPGAQGRSILVGRGGTNMFTTTNTPVKDLIVMAFGLHPDQISGGGQWIQSELFDISAKPDREGVPNIDQLKEMVKGLLADRFQLKYHTEKKELSVYALTVAKTGPKITKVDTPRGNLPGFGGPPGAMTVRNSTMSEFAGFLQSRLVERAVVDQTGLTGRFDMTMRYTPDARMMANFPAGAPLPPAPADGENLPDFFGALQQQLGLRLEGTKAPVDVMVIDKVEKPSDN